MSKILVVDDLAQDLELLTILASSHEGAEVFKAANGNDALEIARREKPDLLIADIKMPVMDGYELVRRIREDPLLKNMEVIFYTAHFFDKEAAFASAIKLGVSRVIFKPTEPSEILKAIDLALQHKEFSKL